MNLDLQGSQVKTYDDLKPSEVFYWLATGKPAVGIKMSKPGTAVGDTDYLALHDSTVRTVRLMCFSVPLGRAIPCCT